MTDLVATLRQFNRTWSQRVGVLDDSFLGSGRALGPSRVLFEIGYAGATVLQLRDRLGLDSGYLSRLLRQLEAEALVELVTDPDDRRRRLARLTESGRVAWQELEARSDDLARRLVDPLTRRQRDELGAALRTAERITRAATVELAVISPTSSQARAALRSYFDELDRVFTDGFDPGVSPARPHPRTTFVAAVSDGEPVACGVLLPLADGFAEIKRMWVHGEWRGLGLGGRMLRRLEEEARSQGYRGVRLDTNGALETAISMYAAAGYRQIERYNDNPYAERFFEKVFQPGI
ncbi:GCN5-related N-acetyltransferase [metagenome]|uniref:GCN5-related N-acetyltransferase n=1 Tax=metagenome TaxID=256318 RepID=A0A2P2CD85_9ZZZZ